MQKVEEISVFFPAYNLEGYIAKTVENAIDYLSEIARKYEVIVINDGSSDKTGEVLAGLQKKHKTLRVITHPVNRGYGGALKSGFYNARYDWIAFTDGDGQFDIRELGGFIEKQSQSGADMVIGYYLKRSVSAFTVFTSKVWETIVYVLFGLRVKDVDCAFKLINRRVFKKINNLESERGAFISSELLVKAKRARFKIVEMGVHHYPRVEDKRSSTGRSLKVIIGSFVDLFRLWIKLH
jgi:glycosyltransferase involved in cell wall biosynthesis